MAMADAWVSLVSTGIASFRMGITRFYMGITGFHTSFTRLHRSITRLHRGITIIHISAARRRRRRIVDPVHVAFVKGFGDITPSQDHTPSLACQIIMYPIRSPPEVAI